ncbi:MAG: type III-B CRISPR-associated protein Cas10/Cmr2, partial [Pseudomonadota bacterium]|nr:type III-B CRISPR-associated protein Cas10/Cmr2 [Pseudomonadota bacterium]
MSQEEKYFHFTIGPVQSFVAQARRTRDFWAGSFLLSWLAAIAMKSVEKQGGNIIFPMPDEDFMNWLEGNEKGHPPRQGTIPNRFMAEVRKDFSPEQVVDNVKQAWIKLADLVWENDLAKVCKDNPEHRQIWDRQVKDFFEISWVIADTREETDALDKRKNWRNHFWPDEPGVKCTVMDGWQELSGTEAPDATVIEAFWDKVREQEGDYELRPPKISPREHLCAIAFVKRRFAYYFDKLTVDLNGLKLEGWPLKTGVPSVSYMAALHWLEKLLDCNVKTLVELNEVARKVVKHDEKNTRIHCILSKLNKPTSSIAKEVAALDAEVFFENNLQNKNFFLEKRTKNNSNQWKKKGEAVLKCLKVAQKEIGKPTPFYAILLMDGDSLGRHMSDPKKQEAISKALNEFTQGVPDIVYKKNGFLVYAGGDDVLALLPLEDALSCAKKVRDKYEQSFSCNKLGPKEAFTISAAIEFVHVRTPLTTVLQDAHKLLDEVAKDGRGRDAIAVRVWKRGGEMIEWAMPWEWALENGKLTLETLADEFKQDAENNHQTPFSNKFLFKIRERFALLFPKKEESTKKGALTIEYQTAVTLLATDYIASLVGMKPENKLSIEDAKQKVK